MSDATKKGILDWYFKSNLLLRIIIGLILGAIVGLLVGPGIRWVSPFGDLLVRLLRMIVVPVIFLSLVGGAASISPNRLGKVGVKIVIYYICTTVVAITIGLILANIFRPGWGLDLAGVTGTGRELRQPDIITTLLSIVPINPIESMARGEVLPIIFFALIFGISLAYVAESGNSRIQEGAKTLLVWFDTAAETMYKVVYGVLQYAPIGVFALIAIVFGTQGPRAFGPLGKVTLVVYLALVIHLVVTYGLFLKVNKLGFITFLKGARAAMLTAFVTRSSAATLPVTLQCAENNLGIPRRISSFTLPLGATINMDGTAIYQGITAMFVAFAIGQELTFSQQITIIITATLASIGTAGVPGAGAIMLLMVLYSIGMPVTEGTPVAMAYAMVLGIDAVLDMGRTCMNVTGDMVGTSVVAKSEKELDLTKWA